MDNLSFQEIATRPANDAINDLHTILEELRFSGEAIAIKELAISYLAPLWSANWSSLPKFLRHFLSTLDSKEGRAKLELAISLIKNLNRILYDVKFPNSLYEDILQWIMAKSQTLHCERIEARIANFLMEFKDDFADGEIIKKVKNQEDVQLFFQFKLHDNIIHTSLDNLPKAKAALEAAIEAKKKVGMSQDQNGSIDLQNGIMLVKENKHKEAIDFLIRASVAFNHDEDPRASYALKSLLFCKCNSNLNEDEQPKLDLIPIYMAAIEDTIKEVGDDVCLKKLRNIRTELDEYLVANGEGSSLSSSTLDMVIKRLIEIEIEVSSFKVEIDKFARLLRMDTSTIEDRLSRMISEKRLAGKLESDFLILYIDPSNHARYVVGGLDLNNLDYKHDSLFAQATYCLLTDEEKRRYVPDVRDQKGTTDGVYAAGCVEGHLNVLKASEQELIDEIRRYEHLKSSPDDSWRGCGNGAKTSFRYIKKNGLATEEDIPFEGKCFTFKPATNVKKRKRHERIDEIKKSKIRIFVKNFIKIKPDSVEDTLRKGPVMATMQSSRRFCIWKPRMGTYYHNGNDEMINNHSILLVGFGKDEEGRKYFIAKNSYGKAWGHRGYVKIAQSDCRSFRIFEGYSTRMPHLWTRKNDYQIATISTNNAQQQTKSKTD